MQGSGANSSCDVYENSWIKSKALLQTKLDPQIFAAYIKPLRFSSYQEETSELVISAPSRLVCKHVDQNFKQRIQSALLENLHTANLSIKFDVDSGSFQGQAPMPTQKSPYVVVKKFTTPQSPKDTTRDKGTYPDTLNPRYTFLNFVVGNSNQFCHAAAMRVGEQPGASYNPLFIYGGVGLGKTHLLHAIGNAVLAARPETKVLYLSSETFTNELIHALRFAKMDEFKNKMRSIELLLIDDIQFIRGKERTQEEFFHTFNALYSAKNQIVITCDKMPQEIPEIEERLRTRFSWGLIADLQAPDFETRVAILKRKAYLENFFLPEEVAHVIAENISSNVRELEGALTRLHAVSSIHKVPITLELANSALKQLLQPKKVNITIADIKKVVASHFNIKVSEIVSKRRTRNLSFPRHIAMYLCRKLTTASYPEIGSHFGNRDHSSVIHAANVVSRKIKDDEDTKRITAEIENRLTGNSL